MSLLYKGRRKNSEVGHQVQSVINGAIVQEKYAVDVSEEVEGMKLEVEDLRSPSVLRQLPEAVSMIMPAQTSQAPVVSVEGPSDVTPGKDTSEPRKHASLKATNQTFASNGTFERFEIDGDPLYSTIIEPVGIVPKASGQRPLCELVKDSVEGDTDLSGTSLPGSVQDGEGHAVGGLTVQTQQKPAQPETLPSGAIRPSVVTLNKKSTASNNYAVQGSGVFSSHLVRQAFSTTSHNKGKGAKASHITNQRGKISMKVMRETSVPSRDMSDAIIKAEQSAKTSTTPNNRSDNPVVISEVTTSRDSHKPSTQSGQCWRHEKGSPTGRLKDKGRQLQNQCVSTMSNGSSTAIIPYVQTSTYF